MRCPNCELPHDQGSCLAAVTKILLGLQADLHAVKTQLEGTHRESVSKTLDATQAMWTTEQCAECMGVSRSTWLRLVRSGKAPRSVKLGRLTRWVAADVRAYAASGASTS